MWHMWDGGGWHGWGIGILGMALFWVVVIVAIVLAVRALDRTRDRAYPGGTPPPPRESPLEILQRRYASGEIDKKEFEEKKKDLS